MAAIVEKQKGKKTKPNRPEEGLLFGFALWGLVISMVLAYF